MHDLAHITGDVGCDETTCVIPPEACADGYGHCTGEPDDGCETSLTVAATCGDCTTQCMSPTPLCANTAAPGEDEVYGCVSDCPQSAPTLCGDSCVDTQSSPEHCNACDNGCPDTPNGEPVCTDGDCGILCATNFHECNGTCQADDSADNCGPSCIQCTAPSGGTPVCTNDSCDFTCGGSTHRCGASCEPNDSTDNCGPSCITCPGPTGGGGTPSCSGGSCDFTCDSDRHRCGDRCELNTSAQYCGPSCMTCPGPTAGMGTPICSGGSCDFTCISGWHRVGSTCVENACNIDGDCNDGRSCTTDSCDPIEKTCSNTLNANRCLISGTCRTSGERDPNNDCMSCQPSSSTSSYRPLGSGTSCDPQDDNKIFLTCDGAGSCGTPYCDNYPCPNVPQTGQTACSIDGSPTTCRAVAGQASCGSLTGCGQDAEYGSNSHTYATSGAIVTDNATGLVWQLNAGDCDSSSSNGAGCNYLSAVTYCSLLNLSGLTDWRLPTIDELLEALKPDGTNPASALPAIEAVDAAVQGIWSSTAFAADSSKALEASFRLTGTIGILDKAATSHAAVCVHGSPRSRSTTNRFLEKSVGGGTVVYDRATQLTWIRNPSTTTRTWLSALAYCEGLSYAGSSDWRVPDFNELATLLDFSRSSAPLSSIPGATSHGYWSSSHGWYPTSPGIARPIIFDNPLYSAIETLVVHTSEVLPPVPALAFADLSYRVRCVRGP